MFKGNKQSYLIIIYVVLVLNLFFTSIVFAGQKVYFYHTDAAGTPMSMTDASGNVVWQADYKPFGEEQSITESIENRVN